MWWEHSWVSSESGLRMSYLITYTDVNGYLIPNLTYKSGEQMEQLGKYGFLRRDYLKNHKILCIRSCFCRTLLESIFWKWTRQPENGKKWFWNSWHAFSYVLCLWRFWKTKKESFQSNYFGSLHLGLRPYGQPGPLPLMVTLVALLFELEAQIL